MAIPLDTSFLELSKTDFNMARNLDWEKFKVPALEKISKEMPFKQESLRPDIQVIKADYLIKNIDSAFATWKTSPWSAHLNFDHFCEFILPYKVQDPFLPDDWREYCRKFCDSIVDLKATWIAANITKTRSIGPPGSSTARCSRTCGSSAPIPTTATNLSGCRPG